MQRTLPEMHADNLLILVREWRSYDESNSVLELRGVYEMVMEARLSLIEKRLERLRDSLERR